MRTRDECQPVVVIERLRDVLPEGVPCSSRRDAPSAAIVRVRPKQVAHGPFMRHLLHAVNGTDMIECVDGGGKSSVKAKYLRYSGLGRHHVSHHDAKDKSRIIGLHDGTCENRRRGDIRTWFSMSAVRGRKSKRSVKNRQTLAFPYLRKHSS